MAQPLITNVKFEKISAMVWGCLCSKGVAVIRILNEIMTKERYLDIKTMILNISLIYVSSGYYTIEPKLLINTPDQSPDISPIENLWVHLKKKVGIRSNKIMF